MANPVDSGPLRLHADVMAHFVFTEAEQRRRAAVAEDLDQSIEEFFADARLILSDPEWELLLFYVRACLERALEIGAMLHAVAKAGGKDTAYPGRGREAFVRAGLAAWKDSFAPIPHVWRVATLFDRIPGGERRVLADIDALEVIAGGRMYVSLDEEYAAFFATGG